MIAVAVALQFEPLAVEVGHRGLHDGARGTIPQLVACLA